MDNNFSESKPNLSRVPQETELGSVPVSQWSSPYKKQVRNLEFQLTSVSRGRVRPPLALPSPVQSAAPVNTIIMDNIEPHPLFTPQHSEGALKITTTMERKIHTPSTPLPPGLVASESEDDLALSANPQFQQHCVLKDVSKVTYIA